MFSVIASKAKQSIFLGKMDCFVAEPVIGPRFARTRWLLAMTHRSYSRPAPRAHLYLAASTSTGISVE
jgi:hypothetical protein